MPCGDRNSARTNHSIYIYFFFYFFSSNKRTLAEMKIDVMEMSYINVRRSTIWSDTCHQVLQKRFSPMKHMSVKFADNEGNSEGVVDVGGPKREYFRMDVKATNEDSGIFIGPEGCRSLHPNTIGKYTFIDRNEYFSCLA